MAALVKAEGRRAANLQLAEAEIEEMAASLKSAAATKAASNAHSSLAASFGLELFQDRRYSRPLLVGMSLMLFQQVRQQQLDACIRS